MAMQVKIIQDTLKDPEQLRSKLVAFLTAEGLTLSQVNIHNFGDSKVNGYLLWWDDGV